MLALQKPQGNVTPMSQSSSVNKRRELAFPGVARAWRFHLPGDEIWQLSFDREVDKGRRGHTKGCHCQRKMNTNMAKDMDARLDSLESE